MSGIGDLCDQGRCAQILRHIADARLVEKAADRNGDVFELVVSGVLADLGVDVSDGRVRQVVADNIHKVLEGSVAA